MKTRRLFIVLFVIIAILLVILFCKIKGIFPIKTAKYTDKDIEDLVLKGVENYNGHQSFSYDLVENSKGNTYTRRFFHKGQKEKIVVTADTRSHSSTGFSVIATDKKRYSVSPKDKLILWEESSETNTPVISFLQSDLLHIIDTRNNGNHNTRTTFRYIREEKLEGKDCIVISVDVFYSYDGTYVKDSSDGRPHSVYWIEKSTGFLLGASQVEPDEQEKNLTPQLILKDLTFGEIPDKEFEVPTEKDVYKIIQSK